MLLLAAPSLLLYQQIASATSTVSLALLFFCGALVNGPYALITTAVAADLGTQPSLLTRARALATITAIIDGTGSFGEHQLNLPTLSTFVNHYCAALGPFLTGLLVPLGWSSVFVMLIIADLLAWCVAVWIVFHTRRSYVPLNSVEKDLFGI
ncbi:Sugar phosphate exchanger 2 [Fasciolopsis buskii]|uniref:Sugar phosphate exchanger 2 n=1 Tax=Fasciolopsis buskii TaxID=27845 RepID=A0A8E0RZS8_9TREM|nr:Sugar phosphate exchanger 2 [Fasciolopsis buski]